MQLRELLGRINNHCTSDLIFTVKYDGAIH